MQRMGKSYAMVQGTSTAYHTYAGVLVIISSCILIALTSVSVLSSLQFLMQLRYAFIVTQVLSSGMSIAVEIIGLVGGIMSLVRRNFVFAVVGASFILLYSVAMLESSISVLLLKSEGAESSYPGIVVLLFSVAAFFLSLLAVVYIAKAKAEFSD